MLYKVFERVGGLLGGGEGGAGLVSIRVLSTKSSSAYTITSKPLLIELMGTCDALKKKFPPLPSILILSAIRISPASPPPSRHIF